MDEFEIMRQQLASMKQQLDTQKIVNKNLMCKVMKAKASWINRLVSAEFVILPIAFLLIWVICHFHHLSQWYSITFLVCGGIDVILDMRTLRIPPRIFSSYSIIDLKKFMARRKKELFIQTCCGGAFSVIWIMLFLYSLATSEVSQLYDEPVKDAGIISGIIGGAAALIIIAVVYRKIQCTNREILNEVGKFENDV